MEVEREILKINSDHPALLRITVAPNESLHEQVSRMNVATPRPHRRVHLPTGSHCKLQYFTNLYKSGCCFPFFSADCIERRGSVPGVRCTTGVLVVEITSVKRLASRGCPADGRCYTQKLSLLLVLLRGVVT